MDESEFAAEVECYNTEKTLTLIGSYPNPNLEVTLTLMGSYPNPYLEVTLTLMGSYPNPNLEVTPTLMTSLVTNLNVLTRHTLHPG